MSINGSASIPSLPADIYIEGGYEFPLLKVDTRRDMIKYRNVFLRNILIRGLKYFN